MDVVRLRMPDTTFLLSHPDDIRHVLGDNSHNYLKGRAIRMGRRLLGEGLLSSDGAIHTRHVRMVGPCVHRTRFTDRVSELTRIIDSVLDAWQDGQAINML